MRAKRLSGFQQGLIAGALIVHISHGEWGYGLFEMLVLIVLYCAINAIFPPAAS